MVNGTVVSIQIAAAAGAPMVPLQEVRAVRGKGLEGDRYFTESGTFSNEPGPGRDVTLIEMEAIAALKREYGIALEPKDSRRNIVTRGAALNHLVNREFTVGDVRLRGVRLCDPCAHLEKLTQKGVMRALVHRGGLRAAIVSEGTIRVDDVITIEDL